MPFGRLGIFTAPLIGLLGSTAAFAEPVSETAPLVSDDLRAYEPTGFDLGGIRVMPRVEYIAYADNNVYASQTGTKGDAVFNMAGVLEARRPIGNIVLRGLAAASIRRYADLTTENSESATVEGGITWQPRIAQSLNVSGGWRRVVEERGEPESRLDALAGPRLINIFETVARYSQESGRMLYSTEAAYRKFDTLGASNDVRDFESLFGSLTLGRAVGIKLYGTGTVYVTHRDFRKLALPLNTDQDETTIGGRLGVRTRDTGLIEGRASVGMFKLNPHDPAEKSRSGLSADVSVTFRPQRRTAFTLDVSSGDVATFRLGAVARADTSVVLGVQQEIRHNLYASAGIAYRRSVFLGSGDKENTLNPRMQVEYLANRTVSLSGYVTFSHRTSNIAVENFDRLRAGISLRLRY